MIPSSGTVRAWLNNTNYLLTGREVLAQNLGPRRFLIDRARFEIFPYRQNVRIYGILLCFCGPVIGARVLLENNALELANRSVGYIGYKYKPYISSCECFVTMVIFDNATVTCSTECYWRLCFSAPGYCSFLHSTFRGSHTTFLVTNGVTTTTYEWTYWCQQSWICRGKLINYAWSCMEDAQKHSVSSWFVKKAVHPGWLASF